MSHKSAIEKIIESFRRTVARPLTPEEELKNLEKKLKGAAEAILVCPFCKAYLKWREPSGAIKEIFPLVPPRKNRRAVLPTGEWCPKCGKRLPEGWRWKQHVFSEEGSNRDYEVII